MSVFKEKLGGATGEAAKQLNGAAHSLDTPDPLPERHTPLPYPVEALGDLLGEAAKAISEEVQVDPAIPAQSVLGGISLAAQGLYDVECGPLPARPVSLNLLTVAMSSDRKSTSDNLAVRPIRDREKEQQGHYKDAFKTYKIDLELWEKQREKTRGQFRQNRDSAPSDNADTERAALLKHEDDKPSPPVRPDMLLEEPTWEGVFRQLENGAPSAGLFSNEGLAFFGGHGMNEESRGRMISGMNKLWDGAEIRRSRGSAQDSGVLYARRMSCHLMVQPVIAEKKLTDPELTQQGWLARYLIVRAISKAGERLLEGRDLTRKPEDRPELHAYWTCLRELLQRSMPVDETTGGVDPQVIHIIDDALEAWREAHDMIETHMRKEGVFRDIRETAGKAADNIARLTALLAIADDPDDPRPTRDHVERATCLVSYYLNELAHYVRESHVDPEEMAASVLLEWIKDNGGKLALEEFNKLPAPYDLRTANTARLTLIRLVEKGHLEVTSTGNKGMPNGWALVTAPPTPEADQ